MIARTRGWLDVTRDDAPCTAGLVRRVFTALDEARRERDAYKRAKAKNDERFMRERDEARTALTLERETSAALAEQCRGLAETLRSVAAERTEARRERDEAMRLLAKVGVDLITERDAARAAAIEECAKVCDAEAAAWWKMGSVERRDAAARAGFRLRALLPEPGQ